MSSSMNFKGLALFALLASLDTTVSGFTPNAANGAARTSALNVMGEGNRVGYGNRGSRGYGGDRIMENRIGDRMGGDRGYGSRSSYERRGDRGYGSRYGNGIGDRGSSGYGNRMGDRGSRYGGGYGRGGLGYAESGVSDQALSGVTTTERFPDQFTDSVMSRGRSNIVQTGRRGRGIRNESRRGDARIGRRFWDNLYPIEVQGGSLKTWSFADVERVQVAMATNGRPLNALVELWNGPDNTPQKMGVYVEDGSSRNFRVMVETPRDGENAIAIRNTAEMEFPFWASVEEDVSDLARSMNRDSYPETIQGGALKTYALDPMVSSARVLLSTDGRPLNARIELLQGPNTNKQVIQLYTEDGLERPFCAIVETPGEGNVVRIKNTAPMEFPLMALVEPYE